MWRRVSSKFLTLRSAVVTNRIVTPSISSATFRPSATVVSRHFSGNVSKKVEDVMPIATGHEREELEAELQGRDILDINHPEGPFGTKASTIIIESNMIIMWMSVTYDDDDDDDDDEMCQ